MSTEARRVQHTISTHLGFFLEIKRVDFLEFTFLFIHVSTFLASREDSQLTSWKKNVALFACKADWESIAPFGR